MIAAGIAYYYSSTESPIKGIFWPAKEEGVERAVKQETKQESDFRNAITVVEKIKTLATEEKVSELYAFFAPGFRKSVPFDDFKTFLDDSETKRKFRDLDISQTKVTHWEPYADGVNLQASDDDIMVDLLMVVDESGTLRPLQFRIFTLY